jgi:hypothetical protein
MLDFLNSVILLNPVVEVKERGSRKLETNPTNGADFRLFKDGRIFPSLSLVEEFNLQYSAKGAAQGNGFDVFSTKNWKSYPTNAPGHAVLIASINKAMPKVDVFSSTKYGADGTPVSKVEEQGAKTFGEELIDLLKDIYGFDFNEESNFVDLKIIREQRVSNSDNIYYIPKKVKKGVNAGQIEHIRRENLVLNPLVIFEAPQETEEAVITDNSTDIISE